MASREELGRLDLMPKSDIDKLEQLLADATDVGALVNKSEALLALVEKSTELLALADKSEELLALVTAEETPEETTEE